jgi:RNA polymerase sigma-32 factor
MQTDQALSSLPTASGYVARLPGAPLGKRSRAVRVRHPAQRVEPRSRAAVATNQTAVPEQTEAYSDASFEMGAGRLLGSSPEPRHEEPSAQTARLSALGGRPVNDNSALGLYLRQVRQYPLLTREEEHEMAVRLAEGPDSALTARLITANLRLVVKIAREYRRIHNNLLDLIQEGNVGLIHAIRKYDPHRGVRICSYASWWIRAYILKFILNNWRLIKVGTTQTQRRLFFNLHKERHKLDVQGADVDTKQLAAALYVSEAEVIEMERRLNASEISLDAPGRPDDQSDRTRGPVLCASASSRPDLQIEDGEFAFRLREKVASFGTTLRDRDLEIFECRLNNDDEPVTLVELAERFGVTRERARQIEARIKRKLRTYLRAELGDSVEP